jgi:transcriptional regulator with XRE-family HTH domain
MENRQRAVGEALLALRRSRRWSQEDAAHAVGVSVSTWGDWERGKHDPYETNWRRIEQTFEVDATEIRGEPPTASVNVELRAQLDRIEQKLDQLLGDGAPVGNLAARRKRRG